MNRRFGAGCAALSLLVFVLPVALAAPAGAAALGGIRSIAAGTDTTCSVQLDTTARCWGENNFGQVGDGTKVNRTAPVVVENGPGTAALKNVAQIAVGTAHTCALLRDGTARCWGQGGELGDGTNTTHSLPVPVLNGAGSAPIVNVTQISAGEGQTCVRMIDGTARCWGFGALGDGRRGSRLPVRVLNGAGTASQTHIAQISVGHLHTCVRITDGTARCWGFNPFGELGNGTTTDHPLAVKVSNVAGTGTQIRITQIVAGYQHTCARIADGTARCWGRNDEGELGIGTRTDHSRPVVVRNGLNSGSLQGVAGMTVDAYHSCARIADGTARCWGVRQAIGDANNTPTPGVRLLPAKVMNSTGTQPLTNVAEIETGVGHTCVRESDNTARCFGENGEGEVGDGTKTSRHFPVTVI